MRVRDARPVDAATVRAIARESWHAAYDDIIGAETVEERVDEWYAPDSLAETIDDVAAREDAIFLVAEPESPETDGEAADPEPTLAGFAHAGPEPEVDDAAKLIRIYVRPGAWGDGLGRRLLGEIETGLRDHYDRLRLEVLADNDVGVSFYESTGFERVGEQESVLGDDAVREYLYEKGL